MGGFMPSGLNPRFSKVGKPNKNQLETPQPAYIIYQQVCISGVDWFILTRPRGTTTDVYKHAGTCLQVIKAGSTGFYVIVVAMLLDH